jgi:protein-L-isoaspartate O-methyltransferase
LETAVQEPRTTSLSFPDVDPGESLSLAGQGTVRQRRRDPEEIDSVFVPTPHDVVEKMLALAAVKAGETVCDLGSGDGRILITAAKEYGARAVGYEIDADLVETSRRKAKEQGVDHLVTIEEKDFFTADFSESQVVTLYLTPKVVAQLVPQLKKLKAGSRIVAHEHPIPGLRPHRVVRKVSAEDNREHTLYLWTAPLE